MNNQEIEEIKHNVGGFQGSETFYKSTFKTMIYTEGIKYIADSCGAYWLIDFIESYQSKLKNCEFQVWTLEKEGNKITTFIPPTIPGILEIKTFEVIHKKCLGKRYIYTRVDCSEFANLTSIDTNALKCSGLLDLKDRVRCRINPFRVKSAMQLV